MGFPDDASTTIPEKELHGFFSDAKQVQLKIINKIESSSGILILQN
jgi:hypothetical protein